MGFMKPLYLIDGYGLIYRAYFAFARTPMKNVRGQVVSATFGFFRMVLSIIKDYKPELLVLVLDPAGQTFRSRIYPPYKATRQATPDDLKAQFPIIDSLVAALELPVLRVDDYEADDVIATMAEHCRLEGRPCRIISADKDLMQLVDELCLMLRPSKSGGFELCGREEVRADKGVAPEQIIDFLALLGDASDNVPGVKGIGEKTAAKLLGDFGTLDGLYERIEEVNPPGAREKLKAGREDALLSKELVTLVRNVPGLEGYDPERFAIHRLKGKAVADLFRAEGIRQLAADFERLFGVPTVDDGMDFAPLPTGGASDKTADSPEDALAAGSAPSPALKSYDPSTQHYTLVDNLADLEKLVQRLEKEKVLCVDTETDGLDPHSSALCGLALCAGAGEAWYVAFKGPNGTVIDLDQARPLCARLVQNPAIELIGQNFKYDWQILAANGMEPHGVAFDTMVAAWMHDSTRNIYNMDALAQEYLSYQTIHFTDLFDPAVVQAGKKSPELLHFSNVDLLKGAIYSAEDADITFQLYLVLKELLESQKLTPLLRDLEMPLIPILARMEYQGMGLDAMELAQYSQELEQRLYKIEQEIYGLVGKQFNINSTKQLAEILFVERKLAPTKKTKTGYSTDTSVLEELADQDPVPRKILDYRGLAKLKSTYVDALPTMINPRTGRVHTSLTQTGTATGRISSKDPNLQNIPIRDEDGRRIRKAFVAGPGTVFVSADYSQIELVVMAHLAQDPGLAKAFRDGIDVHRLTGSLIFGIAPEDVSPEQRRIAKTINFGVLYGMSAFRLSGELKIPMGQAKGFIDAYFASYPGIHGFMEKMVAECNETGGVRTILGRWRPIPAIHSANRNEKQAAERVAVNTPIQGSAADIVKLAMVRLDKRLRAEGVGARMILQVHDELILEVPKAEVDLIKKICTEEMSQAYALSVPLGVSVESGERWGDMH